jgi:hypothetical protein
MGKYSGGESVKTTDLVVKIKKRFSQQGRRKRLQRKKKERESALKA